MATGIYHQTNVLKFRIMHAVFFAGKPLTCREIAEKLNMPPSPISEAMRHYNNQKPRKYFIRMKPKSGKAYRYKLTKTGIMYLARYANRFYEGFDLSLERPYKVKSMPKRDRVMAKRHAEAVERQRILDETGKQLLPKAKPTMKEMLAIDPRDLIDYMGITKQGATEFGITGLEVE